jgi:hypothetical protein
VARQWLAFVLPFLLAQVVEAIGIVSTQFFGAINIFVVVTRYHNDVLFDLPIDRWRRLFPFFLGRELRVFVATKRMRVSLRKATSRGEMFNCYVCSICCF